MDDLFKRITDKKDITVHDYQRSVSDLILSGRNLFLCAPTGSGKTWAALLPYLWAKKKGMPFTDRVIYVLPLRTLATTLYAETVDCCRRVFTVKTTPEERNGGDGEIVITIQTGEQKNDPFFEGDIIFTTVDQCLSSYLNCPVSLPQRVGNINAGALLGSLVVFDEFHLLEPGKSMDTAIEMLERLKPFSQFIIMTATLATKSLESLKDILGGETIQLRREDVMKLPSHKDKRRTYRWINRPLSVNDVLEHHGGKRSIVILNTVTKAQRIFIELKELLKDSNTKLLLLHSRFYPKDRKKTENDLKAWFGKDAEKTDVILVTTQVVEAGIDISADNLHTELAPLNSIVQRAGRCARYEGERGSGTVWVYELWTRENGEFDYGPYRENDIKALVDNTRVALAQMPGNSSVIDFTTELTMVDDVHSNIEVRHLYSYRKNQYSFKKDIHEAMDGRNEAPVREFIRDVASVNVIICHDPYLLKFDTDKWPRMLSVPSTSLYTLSKQLEENRDFGGKVAWYPDEENISNIIDDESGFFSKWDWKLITSKEQIKNVSWLIVIHPDFASYDADLGLQVGVKGSQDKIDYFERPQISRYKIAYETYREHVQRVVEECRAMSILNRNAVKHLNECFKMSDYGPERMAEICCALHDVGKLSKDWQERIRRWQQFKNPEKLTKESLAHSDYDPETDFTEKAKFPKQPPHASEGAYAVASWLRDCIGDEAIALWTAIARHHGAFTESLEEFRLIDDAKKWIDETLPSASGEITLSDRPDRIIQGLFKDDLLAFNRDEDSALWPLYVFLVRRLRLADQKSQKGGRE